MAHHVHRHARLGTWVLTTETWYKTAFVAAVETEADGKPVRLKLQRVTSPRTQSVAAFAKNRLAPDCVVVSDRLRCIGGVTEAGCSHQVIVTGRGLAAAHTLAFKWANTALGNIKAVFIGTYRAISSNTDESMK
nr:transposase [uncultured Lichenicoccus sp.]